jgi:ribonuclease P protein component
MMSRAGAQIGEPDPVRNERTPARRRFPRSRRVLATRVFREALGQGPRYVGRILVLRLWKGEGAAARLGVIASKRTFPRAVDRNRAKRLVREAFRLNCARFTGRKDLIVVARRRILDVKVQDVEKELLELAKEAGLMGNE